MKKRSNKTYHGVFAVQRKNWDPFVPGPAFAIDKTPAKQKRKIFLNFQFPTATIFIPQTGISYWTFGPVKFFFLPPQNILLDKCRWQAPIGQICVGKGGWGMQNYFQLNYLFC
jgi:hypothetical protein